MADHITATAAIFAAVVIAVLIPVALRRADERACRFANETDTETRSTP